MVTGVRDRRTVRRTCVVSQLARAMGLLSLVAWSTTATGAGLALENAMVSRANGTATILVRLRCPHRYLDHSPSAAAGRMRITLATVDDCMRRAGTVTVREASRPPGRDMADLEELEYVSQSGEAGSLNLRFARPVTIEVRQRGDLHVLTIDVHPAGDAVAMADDAEPAADISPEASPAATRTSRRSRRSFAPARRKGNSSGATGGPLYAVNLASATESLLPVAPELGQRSGDWQVYRTEVPVAGRTWYRLRVGFFATEAAAEEALAALRDLYPRAWVTQVAATEREVAAAAPVAVAQGTLAEPQPTAPAPAAGTTLSPEDVNDLMDQGRAAMITTEYPRAVQLYTRVLQSPEHERSAEALEYLGLARERNGQQAHAVAEYRQYLVLYPEGDGAARVRQRLAGLTVPQRSATATARREPSRRGGRWNLFGGLSQYYRHDSTQFADQDRITSQSAILSDFDITASRQGESTRFTSRATVGNFYDLLDEERSPGNDSRVYFLYADLLHDDTGLGARIGRQTLRTGGVLGRFDGAHLSWQWRPDTRFNFLSGFPVDTSADSLDTDRVFYGLSVDWFDLADLVDLSLFYNTQDFDDIQEREAVGGEMRYYDSVRSLIVNTDYDVSYGDLNNLTLMGTWAFENRVTLNAMFDHRKSPFLSTRNALIGQPVRGLDELLLSFSEDELRELAEDRTGELQAITLGVSAPLYERFQLNFDVTMNDYTGTPASGGVAEMPDLDIEYYYSLNLIGAGLMKEGDSTILGLRYADGTNAQTTSMYVETRYPVTRGLRIGPRLNLAWREFSTDGSTEWRVAPGFRLLYRFARHYTIEVEAGSEWSSRDVETGDQDYNGYFIYAGYRADF